MPVISTIPNQVTGFDTQGAIDQLLAVQQRRIDALQQKQVDQSARQEALTTLNTNLSGLRQTAIAMADAARFFAYTASLSSNNASVPAGSLLDVSGTNSVSVGAHTVTVNRVAAALRIASSAAVTDGSGSAITDQTSVLGYAASSFQINGVSISVTATDSLQNIADRINQANTGATATGVSASIVKSAAGDFRLVLAADNTGSAGFALSGSALATGGALSGLNLGATASAAAVKDASTGQTVGSGTTALNLSGSFTINGTAVNVGTGDSLSSIATTINGLGIGVKATVQSYGASDYRLSLQGDATATTPATTITLAAGSGSVLSGLNLAAGSQTALALAADAELTVDGLTITRGSNKISDALSGLTFDLKQADKNTTLTMNIGVDKTAVRDSVQQFVDDYNKVQDFINQQFVFDAKTGKNGILADEPLLTNIQSRLAATLTTPIPGLAADRNTLAAIGVEPDKTGHLQINDTLFTNFLNTDVNAIRDVFVAAGSFVSSDFSFLVNGLNTPSGTYALNISQAATKSSATATALPSAQDTLTITETASGRQAIITLTGSQTQAQVVNALNAEFSADKTEQHQLSTALTDASTGQPATGSSTLADLGLGLVANDVVIISGTDRYGGAVSGSFTVSSPATDTLSGLLAAIQTAFAQKVVASVDSGGHIVVTDAAAGDSLLSLNLSVNSAQPFGSDTITTEGRYALGLAAAASGAGVQIQSKTYGSGTGFSITESLNPGIFGSVTTGVDVAGTISGLAAAGSGQTLTGTSGAPDGLAVLYSGSTAPASADLVLGVGAAAQLDGTLDAFTNPVTGLIQNAINVSRDMNTTLDQQIADLQAQMEQKRTQLTQTFANLAQALSQLQSSNQYLTNQISAMNKSSA